MKKRLAIKIRRNIETDNGRWLYGGHGYKGSTANEAYRRRALSSGRRLRAMLPRTWNLNAPTFGGI